MDYKVLPFNANLKSDDTAEVAAKQLQELIDSQLSQGYEYVGLSEISTNVAGSDGCLGIGAIPGFTASGSVAVF